jgi:hypothetical protein
MIMKYLFALLITFLAVSCATSKQTVTPDGRPAHVIKCGTHQEKCFIKAGQVCPNGYKRVEHGIFMIVCRDKPKEREIIS